MYDTIQTLIKPSLDKKPYRLRCRFKIDPHPWPSILDREKVTIAERFVQDMAAQGWIHDNQHPFKMTGPYPQITPITIHRARVISAREMLPQVAQGNRFLDQSGSVAGPMPILEQSEYWEYELAGIFYRDAIMVEMPDLHEEQR